MDMASERVEDREGCIQLMFPDPLHLSQLLPCQEL